MSRSGVHKSRRGLLGLVQGTPPSMTCFVWDGVFCCLVRVKATWCFEDGRGSSCLRRSSGGLSYLQVTAYSPIGHISHPTVVSDMLRRKEPQDVGHKDVKIFRVNQFFHSQVTHFCQLLSKHSLGNELFHIGMHVFLERGR